MLTVEAGHQATTSLRASYEHTLWMWMQMRKPVQAERACAMELMLRVLVLTSMMKKGAAPRAQLKVPMSRMSELKRAVVVKLHSAYSGLYACSSIQADFRCAYTPQRR